MTDPDRLHKKDHAMDAIRAVQAVLRRWDPIGLAPGELAPSDEYDSYAPHIVSMLAGGSSVVALAKHLELIRTESIGLPAGRDRDMACAEELMGWWKQRGEQTYPSASAVQQAREPAGPFGHGPARGLRAALGGQATVLRLPVNRLATVAMLLIMVIGGIFVAAPVWGPFFLSEDIAFFTAPILGVAVGAPAFAGLCLLVRCRYCRYRLFWYAISKRGHKDSVEWFLRAHQCPQCGRSTV